MNEVVYHGKINIFDYHNIMITEYTFKNIFYLYINWIYISKFDLNYKTKHLGTTNK